MNTKNNTPPNDAGSLRKRAEGMARQRAVRMPENQKTLSLEEAQQLLHELRVHQIELEMQNEDLRRAQAELDAARARYFNLYDLAPVGYCTLTENNLILEANFTVATLLGLARNALVRQPISNFILPEDRDIFYQHRRQLFATGNQQVCELRLKKKDAAPFWARLETKLVQDDAGLSVYLLAISDITARKQTEEALQSAHDELERRVTDRTEELKQVNEKLRQDISERERAEEENRKLHDQLSQAQRMEAVGRLAGGVAHDFNNLLSVIIGRAELAMMELEPSDPIYSDLIEIEMVAKRSADLTRQLLAFARKQIIAPKPINLNEIIESMLRILRQLIGEDITLVWKPAVDLWTVNMDPAQIDQLLANLVINARDAVKDVGKVTIATKNMVLDEDGCAAHAGFSPGHYVLLTVSDNGCGMDPETLPKIFEPFFTTKEIGKGTGLGLSTVYGIIKQNHGVIEVDSKPGQGATFTIYLPRFESVSDQVFNGLPKEKTVTGGKETVLVVEDEPTILEMAGIMLGKLGYTLLMANTPAKAIQFAEEHVGEIHLLVTDVVMPEMNGQDLAKQLLARHPNLKCLFMSGYTADIIAHHGILKEGMHFISKPFTMHDLAVKVRRALGWGETIAITN